MLIKTNKIKRLVMILLIFALLGGLAALQSCGDSTDNASTTEEETIGTTPEPTEPTTPAPTEPPTPPPTKAPIITEEVLKWTFGENGVKFTVGSQTKIKVEDGILKPVSTGGDPFINSPTNIGIDCSEIDYIRVKIKNLSDGWKCQLFFSTVESPNWSEPQSMRTEYALSEGEDWEILEFDTSDCDEWEGTLKQLRFDYLEQEGEVEIEYFSFDKIVKN